MTTKELILGAAWSMDFSELRPFFVSLMRSGYQGKTVIFTDEMRGEAPSWVTFVPFEPMPITHNLNYRFDLYRKFLLVNNYMADRIMLTDMRDVVFLDEPNLQYYDDGLHVFLEDESMTIGRCPFNSDWIMKTHGANLFPFFADKPISCAGITIGDRDSMLIYLTQMADRLSGLPENLDQGFHNGYVWKNISPKMHIHKNGNGVCTMGYMPQGSMPPLGARTILHQYDRHAELKAAIESELL